MVLDPLAQIVHLRDPYRGKIHLITQYAVYVFGSPDFKEVTVYTIFEGKDVAKWTGPTYEYFKMLKPGTKINKLD